MNNNELPKFENINVAGKRVLVRVDFNVPISHNEITDDFRIQKTVPLLHDLKKSGARLTLLSHLTERKKHRSFRDLAPALAHACGMPIAFAADISVARELQKNPSSAMILLENLRVFPEEEQNDPAFARELASLGDLYINEDFSQSHRPYASLVTLPKLLPSFAGPLFVSEVMHLQAALNPPHPFLLILGGVKFGTKLAVIERFLPIADTIFIGGGLANVFFKAQGKDIGDSLFDREALSLIQPYLTNARVALPLDNVYDNGAIVDGGPKTTKFLKEKIQTVAMVVWNGPLGVFERGFSEGTKQLSLALAQSKANVIVGGGETVAFLKQIGLRDAFSHVSTGGGAMLTFLATDTLPAIDAFLKKS